MIFFIPSIKLSFLIISLSNIVILNLRAFESLISNIDGRQSFVEGMNLNKISKDKIKQNILNPVYKDKKTGTEYNSLMYKQTRNPVEFEMLINYYDTLGLFNLDIAILRALFLILSVFSTGADTFTSAGINPNLLKV